MREQSFVDNSVSLILITIFFMVVTLLAMETWSCGGISPYFSLTVRRKDPLRINAVTAEIFSFNSEYVL